MGEGVGGGNMKRHTEGDKCPSCGEHYGGCEDTPWCRRCLAKHRRAAKRRFAACLASQKAPVDAGEQERAAR